MWSFLALMMGFGSGHVHMAAPSVAMWQSEREEGSPKTGKSLPRKLGKALSVEVGHQSEDV